MRLEAVMQLVEDKSQRELSEIDKMSIEFAFKQGGIEAMKNLIDICSLNNIELKLLTSYIKGTTNDN